MNTGVAQDVRLAGRVTKDREIQAQYPHTQRCVISDLITGGHRVPEVDKHKHILAGV